MLARRLQGDIMQIALYYRAMAKGSSVPFLLRLPPDLYAALRERADRETRSVNGEIVHLLQQIVARDSEALSGMPHGPYGPSGRLGRATTQGQPLGA
jgi:hypothetical protein